MSTLYKEELLEHYKDPQNFVELEDADIVVEEHNPLCGDYQKWYIKTTEITKSQKTIEAVGFTGDGCAISIAASSMLSDVIKGKTLEEVQRMGEQDMVELIGTHVAPARMKCLMLGLHAVQQSKGITHE